MNSAAALRIDHRGRIEPTIGNVIAEGETVVSSDRVKMFDLFGDMPTASGAVVTPGSSMRVSAVYASVRLLAGMLAGVAKHVYQRDAKGNGTKVAHDFWWLLNELPCAGFSAATFWEWIMACILLRGDGIAYIQRNRAGQPIGFVPWHRDNVFIKRVWSEDAREPARSVYLFHSPAGNFAAEAEDVLHFPGFGFDGQCSMSVIQWGARNGIGIAQRSDEFAGKFFSNGGSPQFAVKVPGKFNNGQQEEFTAAWERKYGGANVGPNIKPLILTEGLSVEQLSMTGRDAQLLESRQWNVIDIARAFGLPPFMIGEMGKATYNNTENLGTDVVKYTLGPHIRRCEQELNIKLFRMPRFYIKMNVDALQRGDLLTRGNYYKSAIGGTQNPGWLTVNEIRALEDAPPVADGNRLERPTSAEPEPAPEDEATPAPPAEPDGADSEDETDDRDAEQDRKKKDRT